MKLGFIGFGRMGSRMVQKLVKEGHGVVVWNRSPQAIEDFKNKIAKSKNTYKKLRSAKTIQELLQRLEKPRVAWVMVTAGSATQDVLDEISKYTEAGDIVIDGGNAYYKDTERRSEKCKAKNVKYLGIGVSGGVIAAKEGYPLMVGGDKSAYEYIKPVLDSLAKPNGEHEYFGVGGAGHFVKMVHNGIEYGIMQSLGEGFGILEKAPYNFDLLKIAKLWQKGTLVSGFMLDRAVDVLSKPSILSNMDGVIDATGEAEWAVKQAKEERVAVEIIERSLKFRRRSQKDPSVQKSFTARMVAALRQAFGGHPIRHAQGKGVKKK